MNLNMNLLEGNQQAMLVEKWGSTLSLVESAKQDRLTPEAKGTLAQLLENTELGMRMLESTDANQVTGIKQFALDLVSVVVPNLVAESKLSLA